MMQHGDAWNRKQVKWYLWPLIPPVFVVMLVLLIPIGVLALLSIPIVWLYPDRHKHIADVRGTPSEKARLVRWRAAYARLSFTGRVRRAMKRSIRRRSLGPRDPRD
jgi:hypothetical protein